MSIYVLHLIIFHLIPRHFILHRGKKDLWHIQKEFPTIEMCRSVWIKFKKKERHINMDRSYIVDIQQTTLKFVYMFNQISFKEKNNLYADITNQLQLSRLG